MIKKINKVLSKTSSKKSIKKLTKKKVKSRKKKVKSRKKTNKISGLKVGSQNNSTTLNPPTTYHAPTTYYAAAPNTPSTLNAQTTATTQVDCLKKYKLDLISLVDNYNEKNYISDSFSRWYLSADKEMDGVLPKHNPVIIDDLHYANKEKHTHFDVPAIYNKSSVLFKKYATLCSVDDLKVYPNKDSLVTPKQLKRLKELYIGPESNYELIKNKLINLYDLVGMNNIHLSIPPIYYGVELFGSPLNTHNKEYCSPFEIEKQFGSLGSFFKYNFHKSGIYLCNPPFDESIIEKMAKHLEAMYDVVDQNKGVKGVKLCTTVITIPVWDSESQRKLGLKDYGKPFEGLNIILKSKYLVDHRILGKKEYPYYNYYTDSIAPAVPTHLIILSNDSKLNVTEFTENLLTKWRDFITYRHTN